MEANIKNKNSFYRLIKKQRGRLSNHIDELSVGDTVYSTENNILSGWKHHFENLTKNSIHEHFDNKYQQKIEQEYIDIIDICRAMFQHQSITENEIVEALKLLNLNKSPDIFGVSTENLLYGGQSLIYHLKELLDSTFRLCYIPDEQKLGIVIPLFKNKGSCKDSKNYRGITITPTLSKLIEAVLKIRINPDIIKYQNPLQRGFTKRTAPLNCSFIIEEYHKECTELNDQIIITMLDAKSAFDAVKHAGLIRRLYQMKIPEQSILIIDNLYKNAVSCVKWNNQISDTFRIEQGVRQGGTLSADLYKIYINTLLDILADSGYGGKIGSISCCAPTCADDLAILSNCPYETQILIDMAFDFSKREAYLLQPAKSCVIQSKSRHHEKVNENFWKMD
ncbi:Hypothetical predicted protein [Mytilus galloprovincialis]|uniref:Reverse transcriptase domain-containing protein n=1 Tax=Mytilus galloprovincialis TaxID=29158 RepID=A0A8B6EKY8_MYTGA|nr:Hypothetical predicted protein [Mytilus galloprovincialis]